MVREEGRGGESEDWEERQRLGGGVIKGACSQGIESVVKGNKIGGGDAGSSMENGWALR